MKERTGRLVVVKDDVRKAWEEYFDDLYNWVQKSGMQSIYMALMVLQEVIILGNEH